MPLWLIIVLVAHFIYAAVFIADRFVVSKAMKSEYAYTFYISVLSLAAFVFAPFGFSSLERVSQYGIAFIAGSAFTFASLFFFKSLKQSQAAHVAPFVGGLVPLFTLVTSYVIGIPGLPEDVMYAPYAILLLVSGSFIIGFNTEDSTTKKLSVKTIRNMVIASALFGISFATTKLLFTEVSFVNGLIWSRIGSAMVALLLLLSPQIRKDIHLASKKRRSKLEWLVLSNKLFGAVALVMLLYAISLTNATVVNALQGVQYVFLIGIVVVFGKKYPKIIGEKLLGKNLLTTSLAVALIITGLIFIGV